MTVATGIEIRHLRPEDWPEVAQIYADGIATGSATFETHVPPWEVWDGVHSPKPRLVATSEGAVVGWAAVSPVSARPVYRGVAEISLYVAEGSRGKGIGAELLADFIDRATEAGIWTLQTSVFPENKASLALLGTCGFRVVGRRERIGQHEGVWRDTLLLERRSEEVG